VDTRRNRDVRPSGSRHAEVTTDTGSVEIIELGTTGPPPRGMRATAFLVAGILLALGVGGLLAVNKPAPAPTNSPASADPLAIATRDAVPSPSPTARPTATPRPTAGRGAWDAYEVRGFDPATRLRSIWGFGNRFVVLVVTPTRNEPEPELHSLLVSTDGSAWSRAVRPAPGFLVELGAVVTAER